MMQTSIKTYLKRISNCTAIWVFIGIYYFVMYYNIAGYEIAKKTKNLQSLKSSHLKTSGHWGKILLPYSINGRTSP
jgi:hypothetical protein